MVSSGGAAGVQTVDEFQSRGKTHQKQQSAEVIRGRDGGKVKQEEVLVAQGGGGGGGGVGGGGLTWMERGVQMGGPLIHGG